MKSSPLRATISLGIPAIVLKLLAMRAGAQAPVLDTVGNALLFGIVGMLIVYLVLRFTRTNP